jgi:outer membrane protein, heavy metal efflux system
MAGVALVALLTGSPTLALAQSSQISDENSDLVPEENASNFVRITWRDVVELVDTHPGIHAGRHESDAARAAVNEAGAVPNPTLEANAAYGQAADNSTEKFEWGLSLSIPFSWIAQRSAKIDRAKASVVAADAELKVLRRDVLGQLCILFWTLAFEQERVRALVELEAQMTVLSSTVKKRVTSGEARPVEATRVEVESQRVAGKLDVATLQLEASRAQLAVWIGASSGDTLVAEADMSELPRPLSPSAVRNGFIQHPSVHAAKARVESLVANVNVERRARVPSIALEIFNDNELDRTAYGLGLEIDLPLWNWNSGSIRRSEHMLAAQREKLRTQQLVLKSLAIETQSMCRSAVTLATRFKNKILPSAVLAANTVERSYQLGETTLLDVIDARRTLLEMKREFLNTFVKAHIECSRLRTITGKEELQ